MLFFSCDPAISTYWLVSSVFKIRTMLQAHWGWGRGLQRLEEVYSSEYH